jgi:UDP-N-acetylmuramoyl-tripeptide--D-alanyl-D-alanine ligase
LRVAKADGDIWGTRFELDGRHRVELPMPGLHHATNAAAAFAVARWFGIAPEEIINRLRTFTPPEGRMRLHKFGGLVVIDDAYNANPASMAAAIKTLCSAPSGRSRRVCVMGDMLELGPGSAAYQHQAVQMALDVGVEILVAVGPVTNEAARSVSAAVRPTLEPIDGQAGKPIQHAQTGGRPRQQVILCEDADAASDVLMAILANGDTVLVKGSRGMNLDRVVSALGARFAQPVAVA